jgi:hypothetical protein
LYEFDYTENFKRWCASKADTQRWALSPGVKKPQQAMAAEKLDETGLLPLAVSHGNDIFGLRRHISLYIPHSFACSKNMASKETPCPW